MTQNIGELQTARAEGLTVPKPLDSEIMGGIAIVGALHDDAVEQVALHLQKSFDVMRAKAMHPANASRTKEIGQCIAYSTLELGLTDVELMDSFAKSVSEQQNHGMQTSDSELRGLTPNLTQVWLGYDAQSKHDFKLVRSIATLLLDDYSYIENSSIWALKAAPRQPTWGWM